MTIILNKKIAEGGCSEVFEIGNNRIIKLAKANTSFEAARREYQNSCIAHECGLPVPQPFEFIEVSGRPGIIVEHISGETILERFFSMAIDSNEINQADIRLTAQLLSEVHSKLYLGCGLPPQRNIIKNNINSVNYLSTHEKVAIISLLEHLPTKQYMCHGDPNPGNIIIKNDGNAVLIDWMNASIGNPEADIAEYIIMISLCRSTIFST
ncbi:phosphotransferase family protein [Paenibacillus tarimensis]